VDRESYGHTDLRQARAIKARGVPRENRAADSPNDREAMTIASWLAGATRRIKNVVAALVSSGKRSEKRAIKLARLVENAPGTKFKPVPGSKGRRYFLPSAPKTAPTISERQLRIKRTGLTPEAQAAGAERPRETYKSENIRLAADQRRKKGFLKKLTTGPSREDEQRAKARDVEWLETRTGSRYKASDKNRDRYLENRRKWIEGETLDWAEFNNLRDYAEATNDPIARVLNISPKGRFEKLKAVA
jgi:hypothetical protein